MPVLQEQVMPEGVTLEFVDAVIEEADARQNPPAGLIFHVHFVEAGRTRLVVLWETEGDMERFRLERLLPAMERVAERTNLTMAGPPETKFNEVATVIWGA